MMLNMLKIIYNIVDRFSGISLKPRDRILSAFSDDGVFWQIEPGVRINCGMPIKCEMVYSGVVFKTDKNSWKIIYRGSFICDDSWKNSIFCVRSEDCFRWKKDKHFKVYPEKILMEYNLSSPTLVFSNERWQLFVIANNRSGFGGNKIISLVSADGCRWYFNGDLILKDYKNKIIQQNQISEICACNVDNYTNFLYVVLGNKKLFKYVSRENITWCEDYVHIKNRDGVLIDSVTSPYVLKLNDDSYLLYYTDSVKVFERRIYCAASKDASSWEEIGAVIEPDKSNKYSTEGVGFPFVAELKNGKYRMFYTGYWGKHFRAKSNLKQLKLMHD